MTRSDPAVGSRPRALGLSSLAVGALLVLLAACSPSSTPQPTGPGTSPDVTAPPATSPDTETMEPTPGATGEATMAPESPSATMGMPESCTVVATGLLNPRGIGFGPDGTLYIAEAGEGGEEPDLPAGPAASPESSPDASPDLGASPDASPDLGTEPLTTHGDTGRISMVTPDGTQQVLVDGLTSYLFGVEVVGPADVTVGDDGTVYASIGGPGPLVSQIDPAGYANQVVSIDSAGTITEIADIGEYEVTSNPDPNAVDSNLGGITMGSDGLLYVVDAGGNALYSVDPATGEIAVATVFEGLPSPGDAPNPARGDRPEVDPVPTDVTAGADGTLYVGFLTGGQLWGVPGSAKVVSVTPDATTGTATVSDALTGLYMVVGVAESNGTIYATELSTDFTISPPTAGAVISGAIGGTPEPIVADLPLPYGVAVGPDGAVYVAINSTGPMAMGGGQVVSCQVDGETPASPDVSPEPSPGLESPEATESPEAPETEAPETEAPETEAPASESPLETLGPESPPSSPSV